MIGTKVAATIESLLDAEHDDAQDKTNRPQENQRGIACRPTRPKRRMDRAVGSGRQMARGIPRTESTSGFHSQELQEEGDRTYRARHRARHRAAYQGGMSSAGRVLLSGTVQPRSSLATRRGRETTSVQACTGSRGCGCGLLDAARTTAGYSRSLGSRGKYGDGGPETNSSLPA